MGPPGLAGHVGVAAAAVTTIASWHLDREHYRATPIMSDGTPGAVLNLRPLFEQGMLTR